MICRKPRKAESYKVKRKRFGRNLFQIVRDFVVLSRKLFLKILSESFPQKLWKNSVENPPFARSND
jgi:hypothetical protein